MLAGAVAQRVVLHHANPRDSEPPAVALKGLSRRTSIAVTGMIVDKILAREGVVRAFGFVEHRDVRLDPAVIHQPVQGSLLWWRYLLALIIMFAGIRLAGLSLLPPAKGQTPDTRYTCLNHRRAMTAQRLDRNRPSG